MIKTHSACSPVDSFSYFTSVEVVLNGALHTYNHYELLISSANLIHFDRDQFGFSFSPEKTLEKFILNQNATRGTPYKNTPL